MSETESKSSASSPSDSGSSSVSWGKYLIQCAATYAALFGLWLLFTSQVTKPEVCIGLGAAAVGTVGAMLFEAVGLIKFNPRLRDWMQGWRIPWYMLEGTWELLQALCKQLFTKDGTPSIVYAVPFDVGGDDSVSAGRRALAITYTTLTPNFVVVGIVAEQRLLVYHQVIPGPVLEMTKKLGAEA